MVGDMQGSRKKEIGWIYFYFIVYVSGIFRH